MAFTNIIGLSPADLTNTIFVIPFILFSTRCGYITIHNCKKLTEQLLAPSSKKSHQQKVRIAVKKVSESDLEYLFTLNGWDEITRKGGPIFGERQMRNAMAQYGEETRILRESGELKMERNGLLTTTAPTLVRSHQFSSNKSDDYSTTY